MRTKIAAVLVGLAASVVAMPAQAVLDEGGGAAQTAPVVIVDDGFRWSDAGVGAGISVALVAALGTGIAVRRHHSQTRGLARPAA